MINTEEKAIFNDDARFDFPPYLVRVTAGTGGESYLILGGKKAALYDTGMAFAQKRLIANIERGLQEHGYEGLEYVILSHTHYDHIGALPYILSRWPSVKVCGAEKTVRVFKSKGAKETMVRLGIAARDRYAATEDEKKCEIRADNLRCDIVMADGDSLELGGITVSSYVTKGHTDCSMTFMLEPYMTMLTSESTGVLRLDGKMYTAILKDYFQTIEAAEKCKALKPKMIIGNHYGRVPECLTDRYFDLYIEAATGERSFIVGLKKKNLSHEEILKAYESVYWTVERAKSQPKEAFYENANWIIKNMV